MSHQGEAGLSGLPGREGSEVNAAVYDQNKMSIFIHSFILSHLFVHTSHFLNYNCRGNLATKERRYAFEANSMTACYFAGHSLMCVTCDVYVG